MKGTERQLLAPSGEAPPIKRFRLVDQRPWRSSIYRGNGVPGG